MLERQVDVMAGERARAIQEHPDIPAAKVDPTDPEVRAPIVDPTDPRAGEPLPRVEQR
jgi:hypothetical protein